MSIPQVSLEEETRKRPYPWKCRICGERMVGPVTVNYTNDLEHDGRIYQVTLQDLEILRCTNCGAQPLPAEAEEKLFEELRRQAGLLTPGQISTRRAQLGLNQKDFARLLGVAPETVCRWESGGQIQQRVMNDFMQAFFDVPELRKYFKSLRDSSLGQVSASPPAPQKEIPTAAEKTTAGQR